jgi:hypothetical protein
MTGSPVAAGTPAGSPSHASGSPRPTETHFSGDLEALLVPAPAGSTAPTGSVNGSLTLNRYAALFNDKAYMSDKLDALGFVGAAMHSWRLSNGSIVEVTLVQLGNEAKALSLVSEFQFAYQQSKTKTAEGFLADISLGRYFVEGKADKYGYVSSRAFFTKNDMFVEVFVAQRTRPVLRELLTLAQAQYRLLP